MESEEDKISPENKKRRLKTPIQVEGLEAFYAEHKYPSEAMKAQLAAQLGLSEKQVQGWFCHRRLKDKRHMKEEAVNIGKQESRNGSIQDSANGVKQDSGSSGKKVEPQGYLTSKEAGGHQLLNAMNYPAAVLASELRDQDLFTATHENMEDTFGGSNSASQERSSLHSGNPNEVEALRYMSQNGNDYEMEAKRKKKTDFYMDPCLLDNGEHETITCVKRQLGKEYREDGPPLGVKFQPLPPGAFDTPTEPCYQGNTNVHDLPRLSNAVKAPDVGKVNGSQRFHGTRLPGPRQGYCASPAGLKFEQASTNFERASPSFEWAHSKNGSLNGKSSRRSVNIHLQAGDNYHVPDLNSSMHMDEDSPDDSLSSGFATKSFPSWHKQEKPGRANSETYMSLFYGSKNGTMPGNNGTMGKELPISRPYNGVDTHYNVSAMNTNFNAATLMQSGDRLLSQGDVKLQLKKTTKKERLQEERRIQREHEQALKLKQRLLKKEEKRVEKEKQREGAKFQADADTAVILMNQAKGHAGEIPTSFSDENAANSTSSME